MRYLIAVEPIEGTFIHLLSEFSQRICERASEVLISVLQQIYALGESFEVRSMWKFVPLIGKQKLREFDEERPN